MANYAGDERQLAGIDAPAPLESNANGLRREPRHEAAFPRGPYVLIVKPVCDRAVALLLLVVLSPYFVVVGALVRLKLGHGVMYRQPRVGEGNRVFTMYKFRTMAHDRRTSDTPFPAPDRRVNHKADDDPRHTRLGRALRKWSLDELPQLWNVLVGDMSIVGPRPELKTVVMKYDLWDHPRHRVKPGITGPWQVSPARGAMLHENLEYDVEYVAKIGLWTDLKILATTPKAVLIRHGR